MRIFSGARHGSMATSNARVQRLPSHRTALPASTRQTASTVVADLFSRSNHRLQRPPVSRGAFRHGVPELAGLFLLRQARASCGADCEVKRRPLLLACSSSIDTDRSNNSSASGSARPRRCAPCQSVGHLAAHGKRAAIAFRPPFRCEVHGMKLGRHQDRGPARLRMLLFARIRF
jgi:hypothetical protein